MKAVLAETMRALDRRTIEEAGVPGVELMERASRGIARTCLQIIRAAGWSLPRVLVVAGKGNNGGDGFGVARILRGWGCSVDIWLCGTVADVQGDAADHLRQAQAVGLAIREMPAAQNWAAERAEGQADLVIDALLGTGFSGPARAPFDAAIACVQRLANDALVVSVDVPSGFPPDTGQAEGPCVVADRTVTLGLAKAGFVVDGASNWIGSVDVVDLGLPETYVNEAPAADDVDVVTVADVRQGLRPIAADAHKTQLGRVLLIGGSRRYSGAIGLAARAAVRMGAGLVHVVVPESLVPTIAALCPEAMVMGASETETGCLSSDAWTHLRRQFSEYDACLVGPGLTDGADTALLVKQLIRESEIPLLLDADAINVMAGRPTELAEAQAPVVLTPHPGEFARLMQMPVSDLSGHRVGMAMAASKLTGAVLVLKGPGTVIAQGARASINLTGNAGLATGGSGDVLSGLMVGLMGQGHDPFAAAAAAVWVHGRTADLIAAGATRAATRPSDLIDRLPMALREIRAR